MRTRVIGIGLASVLAWTGAAMAQSPGQQAYEKDEMHSAVHQPTPAERVHERAAVEARARLSRIETRHALGISLERPTLYGGPRVYHPALYTAPGAYYFGCVVPTFWLP
jgi:hypothetical protein